MIGTHRVPVHVLKGAAPEYLLTLCDSFVVARTLAMFLGGNVRDQDGDADSLDSWDDDASSTSSTRRCRPELC